MSTAPTESAWQMQLRLRRKFGSLLSDALYPWFSEAQCTCGYESAGTFLLLDCEEWQAIEVLALAEAVLKKKGSVDWRKFVRSRDWKVHSMRNHPPDWMKKIWERANAPAR